MRHKLIWAALAVQAVLLGLLFGVSAFNASPIQWESEWGDAITAVGHGSYADDAAAINQSLEAIINQYRVETQDTCGFRFSILRSDRNLTIVEMILFINQETGGFDIAREQFWLDTSKYGKATFLQMGDPDEFLTYR